MIISVGIEPTKYLLYKDHNLNNSIDNAKEAFKQKAKIYISSELPTLGQPYGEGKIIYKAIDKSFEKLNNTHKDTTYRTIKNVFGLSSRFLLKQIAPENKEKQFMKNIIEEMQTQGDIHNKKYYGITILQKEGKDILNRFYMISSSEDEPLHICDKKIPFDFERHITDSGKITKILNIDGIRILPAICRDAYDYGIETAIKNKVDIMLTPTLAAAHKTTLDYNLWRFTECLKDFSKTIYCAGTTSYSKQNPQIFNGGAFITGPDIKKTLIIPNHQIGPESRTIIHNIKKEDIETLKSKRKKLNPYTLIPKHLRHTDKYLFKNSKDIADAFNNNKYRYNLKDMKKDTTSNKNYNIPEIKEVSF